MVEVGIFFLIERVSSKFVNIDDQLKKYIRLNKFINL